MSQQQENKPQPQDHHEETENLRVLLEHHWHHCQHLETERYWFTSAYAVVAAGVISALVMSREVSEIQKLTETPLFSLLAVFLSLFTFFGFILTLRWAFAFECHRVRVNKFAKIIWDECGLNVRVPLDPTMDVPRMSMNPLPPRIKWPIKLLEKVKLKDLGTALSGILRTRYLFPLFYLAMLVIFVWFVPFPYSLLPSGFAFAALWCLASFFWAEPR